MVRPQTTRAQEERQVDEGGIENVSVSRPMTERYNIILRISHRDLDPAKITAALGWDPDRCWKAGDQAVTPKGTKLPGIRRDSLWSRNFRYKGTKHITENLIRILDHLISHESLFTKLDEMGTATALYLQLSGSSNIGACIEWEVLKKFADLRIAFELEVFPNMRAD
jgi:hypothetical protein